MQSDNHLLAKLNSIEEFHQIIARGDLEGLKDKLNSDMTPEHRNARGEPPLYTAISARQWSVAAYLIARGANPIFPAHLPATFLHQGLLLLRSESIESLIFLLTYLPNMLGYEVIHLADAYGLTPADLILIQGKKNNWSKHEQLQFLSLLHQSSAEKISDNESLDSLSSLVTAQEKFDQHRLILREEKITLPEVKEQALKGLRKVCRDEFNSTVKSLSINQFALTHVLLEWSERSLVLNQDLEAMQYAAAAFYHSQRLPSKSIYSTTLQQITRVIHSYLGEQYSKRLFSSISFNPVAYQQLIYEHRARIQKNTALSFPAKDPIVVFDFLKENTEFFKELTSKLFNDALKIHNKKPPCQYALLGLGSMARDEMCPYSDLECALLVQEEKPEILLYFKHVIEIFRLLMAALGEIPLTLELRDGQTPLAIKGFHLDEDYNPLKPGMMGNIYTLLKRQSSPSASRLQKHALRKICVITCSDPELGVEYQEKLNEYWKSSASERPAWQLLRRQFDPTQAQRHAINAMKELEYPTELNRRRPTDPIQLKKEFTSFLVQFISHLSLFYGITENNTDTCLKKLEEANKISSLGLRHLRDVLSNAFHLRILSQLYYGEDRDELHILDSLSTPTEALFTQPNEIIHQLYQVLLPAEEAAKSWTASNAELDLTKLPFFATADLLEAKAYERHAGFEEAEALYNTLIHQNPFNIKIRVDSLNFYYMQYEVACRAHSSEIIKKSRLNKVNTLLFNLITDWNKKSYVLDLYIDVYKRLSPELRKYFRQQLINYQYLQKLNEKSQLFFAELAFKLNTFPDEDGQREEWEIHKSQWKKTLEALVLLSDPEKNLSQQKSKITLASPLLSQEKTTIPLSPSKQKNDFFILKPSISNILFTSSGKFKEHKIQGSQHNVISAEVKIMHDLSDSISQALVKTIYFKEDPELCGMSYFIERLHHQIIGHGTSLGELVRINIPGQPPLPIFVSEGISGENFDDILLHSPDKLDDLSHYHFSGLVLLAILTNPGDGKPSNYIFSPLGNGQFTLVSVDHDHALFPAYLEEATILSEKDKKSDRIVGKLSLQVRTILFCLDQMNQPIDAKLVSEFCEELDPYKVLRAVLQQTDVQNEYYRKLFDPDEVKSLHEKERGTIPIPIKKGDIVTLFQKMCRLKYYLRHNPKATLLQCLLYIEPRIGLEAQKALKEPLSPRERLKKMGNYPIDDKGQMLTKTSALMSRRLAGSTLSREGYLALETFHPAKGLAELEQMAYQHDRLSEIQEEIYKGKYHRFKSLLSPADQEAILCGDLHEDGGEDQFKEKKGLMPFQWKKLSLQQQKELLMLLTKIPFKRLQLDACQAITPEIFINLLDISPDLYELRFEEYQDVAINALPNALNNHSTLRFLYLRNSQRLMQLEKMFLPALEVLVTDQCPELKNIVIDAPKLRELRTKNCPNLTSIKTGSQELKTLDCRENKLLSPLGLVTATEEWFSIDRVDINNCPKLLSWNRFYNYPYALILMRKELDEDSLKTLKLKLDLLAPEKNLSLRNKKIQIMITNFLAFIHAKYIMKYASEKLKSKNLKDYYNHISILGELAKINPATSKEVFNILKPLLAWEDDRIQELIIKTLGEITSITTSTISNEILDKLWELSISESNINILKTAIVNALGKTAKNHPTLAKKAFMTLQIIADSDKKNENHNLPLVMPVALSEIIQADPTLAKESFIILKPLLFSRNENVRKEARHSLHKIIQPNPAIVEIALSEINSWLLSLKVHDETFSPSFSIEKEQLVHDVIRSLVVIAQASPNLADSIFKTTHSFIKELDIPHSLYIELLFGFSKINYPLSYQSFMIVKEIFYKPQHDELTLTYTHEIAASIKEYLIDDYMNFSKEILKVLKLFLGHKKFFAAPTILALMVEANPDFSEEAFQLLKPILKIGKSYPALQTLARIVKMNPSLAKEAFQYLKPLLKKVYNPSPVATVAKVVRLVSPTSFSHSIKYKEAAIMACSEIIQFSTDIANEAFEELKSWLDGDDQDNLLTGKMTINKSVIVALIQIAKKVPTLVKKIFYALNYSDIIRNNIELFQSYLKTINDPKVIFDILLLTIYWGDKFSDLSDYCKILQFIKSIGEIYGLNIFSGKTLDKFLDECLMNLNDLSNSSVDKEYDYFDSVEIEVLKTFSLFKATEDSTAPTPEKENMNKISKIIRGYLA